MIINPKNKILEFTLLSNITFNVGSYSIEVPYVNIPNV